MAKRAQVAFEPNVVTPQEMIVFESVVYCWSPLAVFTIQQSSPSFLCLLRRTQALRAHVTFQAPAFFPYFPRFPLFSRAIWSFPALSALFPRIPTRKVLAPLLSSPSLARTPSPLLLPARAPPQARMLARDEGSSSHGSAAAEASMWRRQSVGSVFFAVPIFLLAIVGPRSPAPCSTPFLSTPSPLPSSLSPPPPQHTRVRVRHRRLSPSRPPPPTLSAYLFDEILYKLTVLLAFSLSFFSPPSSSPSQSLCFLLCLSPTLSPSLPISLLFLRVLLLHFLFVLARTRCHERRRGLTARVAATLDKYSRISPLRNSQHVFVCSSWYPVHAVLA